MLHRLAGRLPGVLTLALLASTAIPAAAESPVTPERLENPEPENWLLPYRTYNGWRFSPLSEINRDNVSGLRLAFAMPLGMRADGNGDNQATATVDDGFIYTIDPTNTVFKIDTAGGVGRTVWTFDTDTPAELLGPNRGVALSGDQVIVNTRDGRVLALERETGEPVWEQQIGVPGEVFDSHPMRVKDKIIVQQALGDAGTRGYVVALDAGTGEEAWRFWAVPGPGEPGHETWPQDSDAWMTGGGGIWIASTYDPATNLLFVGTGNPAPAWDAEYRPGDNLYTASTVVLNADTGELAWYHQYTPNDGQERDEISPHLLYDVSIDGETRQVLGHYSRTGFFFTFDRNSGQFIHAQPVQSKIDWTAGIDPKTGKPVEYDPNKDLQEYAINLRRGGGDTPFCGGGFLTGIWPPAYSPETNLVYNTIVDSCFSVEVQPNDNAGEPGEQRYGRAGLAGNFRINNDTPLIIATDAATGVSGVKVELPVLSTSGVLATAGGIVFDALADGTVEARDADTLERLWSVNVGTVFKAAPVSFASGGKQYVAILGGGGPLAFFTAVPEIAEVRNASMLFVFGL